MTGFANSIRSAQKSDKLRRRLKILVTYMAGQGLFQGVSLSIGLLMLRWLSVDNYAQFSVAFSFQSTLSLLSDLGFAGTIIALVGSRGNDRSVVGAYIRSGRHLRNVMLVCLTPLAFIFYVYIAKQHHWTPVSSLLLFLSIVASIYVNGMVSYYAAPLLIHGKLTKYYRHQFFGAVFRLALSGIFFFSGILLAWTASWINCLGFLLIGLLNRHESAEFTTLPDRADPAVTRQMIQYVTPNIPSVVFYALQGQIAVFLISIFGQTRSIAEVGALGRLAQIFLLLNGFNTAVIEPFMAKLPKPRVLRSFLMIMAVAACIAVVISSFGFAEPQIVLLLLGSRYSGLTRETGWVVFGSCLTYMTGVAWTMTGARRWFYWTTTWITIGTIFTTQVVYLSFVRVDTIAHVVFFGVATSAAHLTSVLINCVYGFIRGPKIKIPEEHQDEIILADQMAEEVAQQSEAS